MKRIVLATVIATLLVAGGVALAQPMSQWGVANIDQRLGAQAQRACIYPVGGWAIVNCSNLSAAQSSALHAWSRYVVQCGDDSYIATGDDANDAADSSDGWLPSGAWLELMTTDTVRYVSCLNKNVDSDCRLWECQ